MRPIQLFDAESSTYTYILGCPATGEAVLVDPVDKHWERDLKQLERLGLKLVYTLETHAHADHVTSSGKLRQVTGAQAGAPAGCNIGPADLQLINGDVVRFGQGQGIRVMHTPGHTAGSMCFAWHDNVFTGDTLLIDGCGRTDFQSGSAELLFDSVTQVLFALSDATLVWPAHDYKGHSASTIGWEKRHNSRLAGRSKQEFVSLMGALKLPRPRMIDVAVPANQNLGLPHSA
ncbi:MAG: Zn-dependent hydrolase [Paucimonas sp.]|nr:Zn-dependent hydrolase [Paucimonas sp.]